MKKEDLYSIQINRIYLSKLAKYTSIFTKYISYSFIYFTKKLKIYPNHLY
ncbi:MAG: hypothetical protein ACRCZO_16385 [Cetobacterium sp.]